MHENRLQDVARDADEASETKADTCPTLVACLCMFLLLRLSLYLASFSFELCVCLSVSTTLVTVNVIFTLNIIIFMSVAVRATRGTCNMLWPRQQRQNPFSQEVWCGISTPDVNAVLPPPLSMRVVPRPPATRLRPVLEGHSKPKWRLSAWLSFVAYVRHELQPSYTL